MKFKRRVSVLFWLVCGAALSLPAAACSSELSLFCARGDVPAVKDMLNNGVSPNEIDEEGYTLLMRTVLAGVSTPLSSHLKIAELLCQAGADVDADIDGVTPLHMAVAKGSNFLELSVLLLKRGANPNAGSAFGTPLHTAARSDAHYDIVQLLLQNGADVHAADQSGAEPLICAVTALDPSREKIELLLDAGANVNAVFEWGEHGGVSVLMAAAVNASPEVVRMLLDRGAWHAVKDNDGLTAYDYAVQAGQEGNAELLK